MSEPESGLATALGLGVVQGITEFLPISSDGHLAVFGLLFEVPEASLATTVMLHVGTLLATLIMFRTDLAQLATRTLSHGLAPRALLATAEGRLLARIVVASVPTAVIGLLMKDAVEPLSHMRWVVGLGFFGSAAAVLVTRARTGDREELTLREALLVGTLQGLAVLPGLSRSARTLAPSRVSLLVPVVDAGGRRRGTARAGRPRRAGFVVAGRMDRGARRVRERPARVARATRPARARTVLAVRPVLGATGRRDGAVGPLRPQRSSS
jgi:Bacitracin resistance protein BacA